MSRFLWISLGTLAATGGAIAGASYVHRRKLAITDAARATRWLDGL